jgi:hypothetical protein
MVTTPRYTDITMVTTSSDLHSQFFGSLRFNEFMNGVDLILRKNTLHVSVGDAVTVTMALFLGVEEIVRELDLFDKVPTHTPGQVVKVVLGIRRRQPERYVVDARSKVADWLKYEIKYVKKTNHYNLK